MGGESNFIYLCTHPPPKRRILRYDEGTPYKLLPFSMHNQRLVQGIAIAVALLVLSIFFYFWPALTGSSFFSNGNSPAIEETSGSPDSLIVHDDVVGTGEEAKSGNLLTVNYIGALADGTKFDSSYDRNQPFQFRLGVDPVIDGWDQGLLGMKEGGKRTLIIPASLAYGEGGFGPIPPNATLLFSVELLTVRP